MFTQTLVADPLDMIAEKLQVCRKSSRHGPHASLDKDGPIINVAAENYVVSADNICICWNGVSRLAKWDGPANGPGDSPP